MSGDKFSNHSNVIKSSTLSAKQQNKKEAEHKSLSPLIIAIILIDLHLAGAYL